MDPLSLMFIKGEKGFDLFVCLKELLNAHRKRRTKEVSVFRTISKDGVVCMLVTTVGRLFIL